MSVSVQGFSKTFEHRATRGNAGHIVKICVLFAPAGAEFGHCHNSPNGLGSRACVGQSWVAGHPPVVVGAKHDSRAWELLPQRPRNVQQGRPVDRRDGDMAGDLVNGRRGGEALAEANHVERSSRD
jgi:hypothetical protein